MKGFNVFLNGKWLNKVFYLDGFTPEEVKKSLIEHDNFDARIIVKEEN